MKAVRWPLVCAAAACMTHSAQELTPEVVLQAEPTFRAQLWRTVRTLFVAFVVLSGVGALMEERGLTKGILNNPDMRPQMEMKTRFADVKGVDEAKVGCLVLHSPKLHVRSGCILFLASFDVQQQSLTLLPSSHKPGGIRF